MGRSVFSLFTDSVLQGTLGKTHKLCLSVRISVGLTGSLNDVPVKQVLLQQHAERIQ